MPFILPFGELPLVMSGIDAIHHALSQDDAALLRKTLAARPELRARINEPLGPFDSPLVINARSREMLEAMLEAGADINARSRWWAGGFGLLDFAPDDLAAYALERGARLDVHSAARLGRIAELRAFLASDPTLGNARGGDGKTPLHCARSIQVAELLLDHGAEIDARDIDHESTPAQYLVDQHPDVAKYLVRRGCAVDIFLAAALGDTGLARELISQDPNCLRQRVNSEHFPMKNPRAGGSIYQWTLGFNYSPHEAAQKYGHTETLQLLMKSSSPEVQLLVHCWSGDAPAVRSLLQSHPQLAQRLDHSDFRQLADAARNNNLAAAQLMIQAGLPVQTFGQHHATPLHWAAWHGNVEMVKLFLRAGAEIENSDNEFKGTPLGWAIHGSENAWDRSRSDFPAVVRALLAAGAKDPQRADGTPEVRAALKTHRG